MERGSRGKKQSLNKARLEKRRKWHPPTLKMTITGSSSKLIELKRRQGYLSGYTLSPQPHV